MRLYIHIDSSVKANLGKIMLDRGWISYFETIVTPDGGTFGVYEPRIHGFGAYIGAISGVTVFPALQSGVLLDSTTEVPKLAHAGIAANDNMYAAAKKMMAHYGMTFLDPDFHG